MNNLVRFLLVICLVAKAIGTTVSEGQYSESDVSSEVLESRSSTAEHEQGSEKEPVKKQQNVGRSIAEHNDQQDIATPDKDHQAEFQKRAKPLKNIFMGIYKNYKSTYLGNRTLLDYKKTLRDRLAVKNQAINSENPDQDPAADDDEINEIEATTVAEVEQPEEFNEHNLSKVANYEILHSNGEAEVDIPESEDSSEALHENESAASDITDEDMSSEPSSLAELVMESYLENINKKRRKRKQHRNRKNTKKSKPRKPAKITPPAGGDDPLVYAANDEYRYNVGPGMNMSLNLNEQLVTVNLDGDSLRELITGRWLSDNSAQGRSRKYDMVSKFLPLFILPFLIQSAIVPFLVTKLKLLLMKSILVGKLAIFLLIISAIKNSNKSMQSYEVAPSYWAGEPSRRSELAAIASSAPYSGYRVEGKPTTWIN